MKKFLCICLSSTLQRTVTFENLTLEKVNRSDHYRQDASGKAINTARVLNQLEEGCVEALCPLGEENIELFLKLVENDKLDLAYVTIPGFTRECWTLLDRTKGTTTELVVSEPSIGNFDKEKVQLAEVRLLKYLTDMLPEVEAVILAGSRPSWWSEDLYAAICGIVKDAGKIFLADFIGADLVRTIGGAVPDIIKINDEEYCKTFGLSFPLMNEELKASIKEKSKELGNMVIITRGVKKTFAAKNGKIFECPVEKVNAVNTTACGDSFNAGFIYEYVSSGDFMKALEKGTWCAARNAEVEVPGGLWN